MDRQITTAINYEAEYNNRARVPEHAEIMSGWSADAARWRKDVAEARLDVPYGESVRQCVDIFKPRKEKPGPIALFIHGGYWQALGRESFSHMARGANKHGVTVAVPSYDLCPQVTVVGHHQPDARLLSFPVENLPAQNRGLRPFRRRSSHRRAARHPVAQDR